MDLLLIADPSEKIVSSYLHTGDLYVVMNEGEVVCAAVMAPIEDGVELKNLVTHPAHLRQGYATYMMHYLLERYKDKKICIGTGGTGIEGVKFYQLPFYKKLGFRVSDTIRNYFIDNYPEPIYEDNGMQCVDKIWLELPPQESR